MASSTSTKDYGQFPSEQTKEAAGKAFDKTKEAASSIGGKAKEVASAVGDMVSSAASSVGCAAGKAVEKATSATGAGVKHFGETIAEKAPESGVLGGAARAVASSLEQGGKYLEQEGFSGMIEDVTGLIRRNPMPAILVGIGLGFLIGRTLRS